MSPPNTPPSSSIRSHHSSQKSVKNTSSMMAWLNYRLVRPFSRKELDKSDVSTVVTSTLSTDTVLHVMEQGMATKPTTKHDTPTFLQVMGGLSSAPYTPENLHSFMTFTHSVENLNFWKEVYAWKVLAHNPEVSSQIKFDEMKRIYICCILSRELNIAGTHYLKMTHAFEDLEKTTKIDPNLFDEAFTEIEQVIREGPFKEFLKSNNLNLTHNESTKRLVVALVFIIVAMWSPHMWFVLSSLWDPVLHVGWMVGGLMTSGIFWMMALVFLWNGYFGVCFYLVWGLTGRRSHPLRMTKDEVRYMPFRYKHTQPVENSYTAAKHQESAHAQLLYLGVSWLVVFGITAGVYVGLFHSGFDSQYVDSIEMIVSVIVTYSLIGLFLMFG